MPDRLTEQREREIRERCERATPGEWLPVGTRVEYEFWSVGLQIGGSWCGATGADEDFMAHAREDVPLLLAELAALRADLTAMTASRDQFLRDTTDGLECLPGCDSVAHEELCPLTNPAAAWRTLQGELAALRAERDTGREAHHDAILLLRQIDGLTAYQYPEDLANGILMRVHTLTSGLLASLPPAGRKKGDGDGE